MKKILTLVTLLATFCIACKNKEKSSATIVARDISITPANAYNNLFTDSNSLNTFIANEQLDEDMANRMRSFYNLRNFEFAWFGSEGLTEQARSFWSMFSYQKDTSLGNKILKKQMKAWLLADDSLNLENTDKNVTSTELLLTETFVGYMMKYYGESAAKKRDMESFIPRKKVEAIALADSFANRASNASYEESEESYKLLKQQLGGYVKIAKAGGWPIISASKKAYKKGITAPEIVSIKKRLAITGHLATADTTAIFDDALENAVKAFETSIGYTADGIINEKLVKQLNIPVMQKIQQMVINLDRMRWLPDNEKGKVIIANIPEFKVHVLDGSKKEFEMNVVVGKEGHNTVVFNGNLNEVVFAPYWNLPTSIVKKEILPKMESNSNYLNEQNMEIVSEGEGVPEIRQKPGGNNSLGKVKFLFPNDFDIYFHDTPAKDLFNKDARAYSHGCIRLEDPAKMANYLLQGTEWTAEKINEAMNAATEKRVALKNPVPVIITYYTAWVDENGVLNFRDDIYGNDGAVAKKLFTNPML